MEALNIKASKVTPEISFNGETGILKVTGRSIPADASMFYAPADRWTEKFCTEYSGNEISFAVMTDHLNTGSVRSILSILTKLIRFSKSTGKKLTINWHHEQDDEDMRDKGEEMSLILDYPFTFHGFKGDW